MTLSNRVSLFFLAALAVVLIGYSALLYGFARLYLYRQFDDQLQSAFTTLVAAIEVEPDDVKWEPTDHTTTLPERALDLEWIVFAEQGQILDGSEGAAKNLLWTELLAASDSQSPVSAGEWRYLRVVLPAPEPKPIAERMPIEHEFVGVIAARSTHGLHQQLRWLLALVTVLPGMVWVIAAVAGRAYCRRALAPVRLMAQSAQAMTVEGSEQRLPVSSQRDELAELSTTMNRLLDHWQAAMQRQKRFTGDAAHQLRTPLTVLQGQIDVALRRPRTEAEYRETLLLLGTQTTELRELVEALLFLARAGDGSVTSLWETLDVAEFWSEYPRRWKQHPRWADLSFTSDNAGQIQGSRTLLMQLLDNLISNALKYSPAGTPVIVGTSVRHHEVVWTVQDNGIGISPAEQTQVFEPFFRSAMARQTGAPGTGLGLALAQRIAATHGGTIELTSQPGQGTRFTVTLPLAKPARLPAQAIEPGHPAAAGNMID